MKDPLQAKLEVAANVAIIVVAVLLVVTLVKSHYQAAAVSRPQPIAVGRKLNLDGIDWTTHRRTLLLALQPGCRFCEESAPFYRTLNKHLTATKSAHFIVLLPTAIVDGSNYPESLGVIADDVRQISMQSARISGTPTLILVNASGVVEKVWVGKLSSSEEQDVIRYLTNDFLTSVQHDIMKSHRRLECPICF